jgi:hypothetical protein
VDFQQQEEEEEEQRKLALSPETEETEPTAWSSSQPIFKPMKYIIARLFEPSTWRGLVSLATLFGLKITPDQADAVLTAGVSIYSAINIFRREK